VRLIHGDCLEEMPALPTGSVDLILTDPPYYKVKSESWDRSWDTANGFLSWLGEVADEWARVLAPNGSLYCFASPQMAARVEVLLAERFTVLNHIVWAKTCGSWLRSCKDDLRSFFPSTERIIFCEPKGADSMALGESGYAAQCEELRGFVFEPLRAYLAGEFERAGLLNAAGMRAANVACGFAESTTGMVRHYLGRSQWQLPAEKHYNTLRDFLNERGNGTFLAREYEYLRREYEDLRREYEDLRREYEDLRRPFGVTPDVPYTDVWTFDPVPTYPGKHPCEKPGALLDHIIRTSSRQGATVLDSFMGGGSTGLSCQSLSRNFIGIEKDREYFEQCKRRLQPDQSGLFACTG